MIGYRDTTFCPYWEDCANGLGCSRAITPDVVRNATEWWGGEDFPVALLAEQPECFIDEGGADD